MFCPNCGKELSETGRFCPACGKEVTPAPQKPVSKVAWDTKTLLIIAVAVIVILLAVLLFRSGNGETPAVSSNQAGKITTGQLELGVQTQQPSPTPTPNPASLLVGTWSNADGVGLKFSSDGTLKLSGLGLTLGGDTFTYEVTGENTLTLTATMGDILSADMAAPYAIVGDTLYIEIGDYNFELTKK